MSTDGGTRAWIEVRAAGLRRNLRTIRERIGPGPRMIPMVKADAYGLGVAGAVAALEPEDPWGYGVATVEEGRQLRTLGVTRPVLVFSPLPPGSYSAAVEDELTVCISDLEGLRRLQDAALRHGSTARFHLEVDTGMGRSGFDWRRTGEWRDAVAALASSGSLEWAGCLTHFHSADERHSAATHTQWERFTDAVSSLPTPDGLLVHACNSAAALRCPEYAADAVRPGIYLYGGSAGQGLPDPEAVARVRARVVFTREAPPGGTVGYGATHVAREWEEWATVGIGYGDGLPRRLGNRGEALVRGRRVPIVGRISMDVTVVDISGVDGVAHGDTVTFIGPDGGEEITVDEVAGWAETISYEILAGFTPRVPRVWVDEGDS